MPEQTCTCPDAWCPQHPRCRCGSELIITVRDVRESSSRWPGMECDDANWRRLLHRIEEGK
jgi:hypothetical protein